MWRLWQIPQTLARLQSIPTYCHLHTWISLLTILALWTEVSNLAMLMLAWWISSGTQKKSAQIKLWFNLSLRTRFWSQAKLASETSWISSCYHPLSSISHHWRLVGWSRTLCEMWPESCPHKWSLGWLCSMWNKLLQLYKPQVNPQSPEMLLFK